MNASLWRFLWIAPALLAAAPAQQDGRVERTFAVRIDGRLVGHQSETERAATHEGRAALEFVTSGRVRVELLGSVLDQHIDQTWLLDAGTGEVLRFEALLTMGTTKVAVQGQRGADGLMIAGQPTPLPAATVISPKFDWLLRRGPKAPGEAVAIDWFLPELGGAHPATLTLAEPAEREFAVLGRDTRTRGYRIDVDKLGLSMTVFVTPDRGELVHIDATTQQMVVDRIDPALLGRIDSVDVTNSILVRSRLDVDDPRQLRYLRVAAQLDTAANVTAAKLTFGDQTFEGTVVDGHVDGTFAIRPRRSDGAGAPPFPPPADAFATEALQPLLRPEPMIESDDAAIVAQAKALAAGAADCFQVVDRLARWVHDEITYEIPGGGSAAETMRLRAGECAGHSRVLAALLRSLGIPARIVVGGMWTPLYGGSFCQHVWNEVFLGDPIGWLAVDATAGETTFIDAGHIRLGPDAGGFRPKSIEVLDHEPKAAPAAVPAAAQRGDAWPFAAGDELQFAYSIGGQPIGDEQVTYEGRGDDGHVFTTRLRLQLGSPVAETTRTVVADDGRPIAFHCERRVDAAVTTIDLRFEGAQATLTTGGDQGRTETIDVGTASLVLHNNCMAHWAIALCRLPLTANGEATVRLVHDEAKSVLSLTVRDAGGVEVEVGGRRVSARALRGELAGTPIELHVDTEGRLLRLHVAAGDVTIERLAP